MIEILIYRKATLEGNTYIFRKVINSLPIKWNNLIGKRTKIYIDNSYTIDTYNYNDLLQLILKDEENLEILDEFYNNDQEILQPITTQIFFYEVL